MAKSQNGQGIKDSFSVVYCTFYTPSASWRRQWGGNIFLIQNKGKGPPGRIRSPGAGVFRKPDCKLTMNNNIKTYQKTDFQIFNNYQFSNFYSHN